MNFHKKCLHHHITSEPFSHW